MGWDSNRRECAALLLGTSQPVWMTSGITAILLDDLPEHVVSSIFKLLPGEALATLCMQNRQLRRFMANQSLWRNCCCCRQDLTTPFD